MDIGGLHKHQYLGFLKLIVCKCFVRRIAIAYSYALASTEIVRYINTRPCILYVYMHGGPMHIYHITWCRR